MLQGFQGLGGSGPWPGPFLDPDSGTCPSPNWFFFLLWMGLGEGGHMRVPSGWWGSGGSSHEGGGAFRTQVLGLVQRPSRLPWREKCYAVNVFDWRP